MAQWAVIIPAEQWATERLFQHDTVAVPGTPGVSPATGDEVLLVADEAVVALGTVRDVAGDALSVAYLRRNFDAPVPVAELAAGDAVTALARDDFDRLLLGLGADADRRDWLVSVAMPIEAVNQADAVRQFWSYVRELGPAELPALVWPSGDELAMQSYVLGAEANQDPEEEDEDD